MSDDKKNKPTKKKHRAALELVSTPEKTDRIIRIALKEFDKLSEAKDRWNKFCQNKLFALIDNANKSLADDQKIETLQIFTVDGEFKVNLSVQITKELDGRAELAKAKIQEFLDEYENKTQELDENTTLIISFLKSLFFGKIRTIRFTPQLMDFIKMEESKIKDSRLKEAQVLLKNALHIDKSQRYVNIYQNTPEGFKNYPAKQ